MKPAQPARTSASSFGGHSPSESEAERLLTVDDVAALLQVPRTWVYAQSRSGAIPTVRLGRYYRYEPGAVRAWIQERSG